MNFLEFLEASLMMGIPMVVLSWTIFAWLYVGGSLDRNAGRKSVGVEVKKLKKSFNKKKEGGTANYMAEKWLWFGGGFYGLAALWTFAVIELLDIVRLILSPSTILDAFDNGLVSAVIQLAANQLSNLITAFVWFGYWGDDGILVWLAVAYAGYWIGVELARRDKELPTREVLRKLRSLLP